MPLPTKRTSCSHFVEKTSSCEAGTAYVYLGGVRGLTTKPVHALSPPRTNFGITGTQLVELGDIDSDQKMDFAFGAYVYRGGSGGLADPRPPSL